MGTKRKMNRYKPPRPWTNPDDYTIRLRGYLVLIKILFCHPLIFLKGLLYIIPLSLSRFYFVVCGMHELHELKKSDKQDNPC